MSYCRWSTDSHRCDVYAYEDHTGFYAVHVAGNRIPDDAPREVYPSDWKDKTQFDLYFETHKKLQEYLGDCERYSIGLPSDGQTFKPKTLKAFKALMIELRKQGYHFPSYVLATIDEEIRDEKAERKAASKPKLNIGNLKTALSSQTIDNPDYQSQHDGVSANGKTIKAAFNMNESPIAMWAGKGTIDGAQERSATKFRWLWENSGGSGASALDYSAAKVDTSGASDPISERQINAVMELDQCRKILGQKFWIIQKTCGECQFLKQLFPDSEYSQRKFAKIARDGLNELACHWNLKTRENAA